MQDNIDEAKNISDELETLLRNADERAPSLFKSGNLKNHIRDIINPDAVERLISFAENHELNGTKLSNSSGGDAKILVKSWI